jgi:hypothetical protein
MASRLRSCHIAITHIHGHVANVLKQQQTLGWEWPPQTCSKGPVSEEIAARGEDFVGSEWTFALLLRASSNAGQETAPITELIAETFDALPLGFFHAGLEDFTTSSVAAILLLRGGAGSEVAVPSLCSSLSATTSVCFTPSISWPGTFDAWALSGFFLVPPANDEAEDCSTKDASGDIEVDGCCSAAPTAWADCPWPARLPCVMTSGVQTTAAAGEAAPPVAEEGEEE